MKAVAVAAFVAFVVFLLALAAVFGTDYALRMSDGDIRTGGLAIEVQTVLFVLSALGCLFYVYRSLRGRVSTWVSVVVVALCAAVGFVAFVAAGFLYIDLSGMPL